MAAKIQFKKLVWESYRMGWWICKTPLFTFHVMEVDDNEFTLTVDMMQFGTCIYKDETYTTEKGAKVGAQEWLEITLTQFIKTSENPAQ